jgi:O-antigen chain-terminating methyltransferase
MEEQEVLSTLRAHVARYQTGSSNEPGGAKSSVDPGVIEGLSTEVWNSSNSVGQLNPRNPGLLNQAIQSFKKILQRSLSWYTRPLRVFNRNIAQAIELHGQAINSIQRQLLDLPSAVALDEAFESARLATQEQQSPYVRLFHGLSPIVDLGCGRGEFLELLRDAGIESCGVDSDPSACETARRRRLTIVEADLFQYLKQLPERSLGGVFSARLIEYLPPHLQSEFVALCSSRLKPGGRIVVETINPDSDSPFGRNWRLDPSHLHPIYPEILRSILESNGFHDSQICILAPHAVSVATSGEAGAHSGNGRGGEILQPSVTKAPAYAATGTRA